ncbi:non-ribosomal peptide synthetase [Umezawaea tangerina]|uniref:Amino acid adenylation domain-containing protein n=1 Tax=Umezawaea tangerina TaxID=84725 RepID=A0A2T0TGI9_9PSEU|nr:non-ribosomal peptide synthetase [Umezawaea tangerina]PRY44812.1 amino acid adenylation domain-containing protein [Umezawaea tangerina]
MPDPVVGDVLSQFGACLAATPDAPAVVADGVSSSYAELDAAARGHAAALRAAGAGPESVVALVADRGPGYVGMVLGVLFAGAAFVPLEPSVPVRRAHRMCRTAGVRHLLVAPGHDEHAGQVAAGLDAAEVVHGGEPGHLVPVPDRPRTGLAYVIFTSGSTGTPKGAMVADGGMDNHIAAKVADLHLGAADVVGLTAPLSFDISVWQALTALTVGGRVAVASPLTISEPAELVAWVRAHGVTILEIVPSFLAVLTAQLARDEDLRAGLASLRYLVATGEALPGRVAQRWYEHNPDIPIVNAYGPTECSDDVTHHVVTAQESAARPWPSIGREVLNTTLHVVGEDGRVVPDGTEGELFVGGHGVGRGYIGDPVRTALAFVPDWFSGTPGARLYRTGDRASRAADGTVDFHGRRDRQVKIRGHRVELGDVEAELLRVPGVGAAACVYTAGRLRAFVTLDAGSASGADVLVAVQESAPRYLVPHEVSVLDRMPTNTSGKIDYRALDTGTTTAGVPVSTSDTAAATLDEVRAVVAEALGVASIGPDDDFFTAGGDSLTAMTMVSAARHRFAAAGTSLRAFLATPTPRGLLAAVEAAVHAPVEPEHPRSVGALSSGQERLWFFEQLHRKKAPNLLILSLDLHGRLDLDALRHALAAVVARHEPLRTVFTQERGVPKAAVWPKAEIALEVVDDTADGFGISARTAEPPLMSVRLGRVADDHHVLTLAMHHLVADGWSLEVLKQDIAEHYRRWLAGDTDVELPGTSFSRYVDAEREWLAGPDAEDCTRYWTDQLDGAPPSIDLPLDRPRPAKPAFVTDHVVAHLTEAETKAVAEAARARGATPFMAVLASSYVVLRDAASTTDLVLGIDSVNRSWPGSEELVGTFVNQLPVRLAPGDAPTFGELLDLARRQVLGAQEHDRLPFHKLVAAVNPPRQAGRFPLFQVKVTHQGAWRTGTSLPDLEVVPRELADPVMDLDLTVDVSGENDRLRLEVLFWPEVLDATTVDGWARALADVLRAGAANPDVALPAHGSGER